jgi:hypothetical protein
MNMKKHLIIVATLALAVMLTAFSGCKKVKPVDNTPAPEGLYLGIVGFNSDLYTMPLGLLNQNTKTSFESFVDNLSMQNGTILYHAVNTGLNSLSNAKIPENLINVSVVTFTDGLDQGSYVLGGYNSGADYLNEVNNRIMNGLVGGQNIAAYSIGVRGSDVSDIESFRNNLNKLSSDPQHNVFEVNNMSEASEKFAQIAQQLYNQSTYYNVSLKLPAQEPNTKLRFTFDNVNDATASQSYIEGTYIRTNGKGQLIDIHYEGLECMTGITVTASSEGIFDVFSFQNLTDHDGNLISTDYVKQWNWLESASQWQYNSEFTPSGNTEVVNEYKSAMIMLVLDCSSSLGSDFVNMKTAANGFIETLSGNYSGRR